MNQEQILTNLTSFEAFNAKKKERFYSLIPAGHTRRVLASMLFFIHTNQQRLPGYVNEITPHGIHGFSLDDETRKYLKSAYPTITFEESTEEPFVEMIAVIGSAGTIAYNKKSDFDFWVCVDKKSASPKRLSYFRTKIEKIQEWAENQSGVEIHLFINDINDLKQNVFDEDEDEAFGSTLGALLKDEFYRSSIVIMGKVPFWWVVPTDTDDLEYNKLFESLDPKIRSSKFIDIGNLHRISKNDFIGAALFQIVKSLGNPFKSILKLGVLEKYLFESDSVNLISQQLKKKVHERKLSNTILDAYLLMFANVYRYYKSTGMDKNSLAILKINLYLKISPNLSKYTSFDNRKLPYKVEEMLRYVKHWGWTMHFISDLDSFDNWDFPKVTKFWNQVRKFMLISYQKISKEFAHFDLKSKISNSDYTLLSRKIRGYFSVNPNKIEKYISFKETSGEPYLFFSEQTAQDGTQFWKLQKKSSEISDETNYVTLKQDKSIFPLLAWAAINGVYEKSLTRITMNYQEENIDTDTVELLKLMSEKFTGRELKPKNSYYLQEAFNLRNLIALHYGNRPSVAGNHIDFLYHTSWNEAYHYSYESCDALLQILPRVVESGVRSGWSFDTVCTFYAPESSKKIVREYYRIFKRCYDHIVQSKAENRRFLTRMNSYYVIVTCKNGTVESSYYKSAVNFAAALSVSPVDNIDYGAYPGEDLLLQRIQCIIENAPQDAIATYYDTIGKFVFVFTHNEDRNLFISIKPASCKTQLVSSLYRFSHLVIDDIRNTNPFSYLEKSSVKMHRIIQDKHGSLEIASPDPADLTDVSHNDGLRLEYRADNTYSIRYGSMDQTPFLSIDEAVGRLVSAVRQNVEQFKKHGGLCFHSVTLRSFKQNSRLTTNLYYRERSKIELYFEKTLSKKSG